MTKMDSERKRQILEAEERAALMAALVAEGFYVYPVPAEDIAAPDLALPKPGDMAQQDVRSTE